MQNDRLSQGGRFSCVIARSESSRTFVQKAELRKNIIAVPIENPLNTADLFEILEANEDCASTTLAPQPELGQ